MMLNHIFRNFTAELLHKVGTFRSGADYTHLAKQHVEKLRQLIQAGSADKGTELGPPGIDRSTPARIFHPFLLHLHRAELIHHEIAPVQPHPLLLENDRTRGSQTHPQRHKQHHRRQNDNGEQ
ncbi:hypothetical protein D3C73_688990 [compost metagenome]